MRPNSSPVIFLASCYFLSVLPWTLDFRSEQSGGGLATQALILVFALAFLSLPLFVQPRTAIRILAWPHIALAVLFASVGFLIAILNEQSLYLILVHTLPTLLYCSYMYATCRTLALHPRPQTIFSLLVGLVFFNLLSKFCMSYYSNGFDLYSSRHEIAGASIIPALCLLPATLIGRFSLLPFVTYSAGYVILALSVTRTWLLIAGSSMFVAILSSPHRILFGKNAIAILLLVVIAGPIAALGLTNSPIGQRWIERFNAKRDLGEDPTSLTRAAERNYMFSEFTKSASSLLLGNGIAAETSLIGDEARKASSILGKEHVEIHSYGFGHNNHISLLFVGGLLGGAPLLIMQFYTCARGVVLLHRLNRANLDESLVTQASWGALIVVGYVVYGCFAGTFSERGNCVWYGIGSGILYWALTLPQLDTRYRYQTL